MKLTIHPQAASNCNSKGTDLVAKVQSAPERFRQERGSTNPNVHSVHTFTSKNIIGEITYGWSDFTGNTMGIAFEESSGLVGLFEEDYNQLVRVAESMHKSMRPEALVTLQLLSKLIFQWVKEAYRRSLDEPLTDYVLRESEKQIRQVEIWIPISHFFIPRPFVFGKVSFRAITKTMMDEWEASELMKASTPEETSAVKEGIERRRRRFQALAAAIMSIEAEPDRAHEIAYEETDKTVSLLRFFSPAMLDPRKTSYSAPFGHQHEDSYDYLLVKDLKIIGHNAGLVDKSNPIWNFTLEDQHDWAIELQILHTLLLAEKLTDFQEMVINAIILFSRSLLEKEISDKLIYMLVALESVFLKDTGEFIQDAISLRMAYMQQISVDERKAIVADVKAVYKLRSSFVHHGKTVSVDESALVSRFMRNAWLSLAALILQAATPITRNEFFNDLENRRLAG